MKRSCSVMAILIAMIMVLAGGIAGAAEVKIGMIDIQKIMLESKAAKKARDIYMKELETKKAQLIAKDNEARKLDEEIKKEGANMAPAARQDKTEKLEKEIKELGRLKADMEDELKKKDAELTRKVAGEILEILKEFQKKEKYTIILDKRNVVMSDEAINITDKIIRLYDAVK